MTGRVMYRVDVDPVRVRRGMKHGHMHFDQLTLEEAQLKALEYAHDPWGVVILRWEDDHLVIHRIVR